MGQSQPFGGGGAIRYDAVDQAPAFGVRPGEVFSQEHDSGGPRGPELAGEGADDPGIGGQADAGERGREAGALGGDLHVGAERDAEPGPDAGALDGHDQRDLQCVQLFDQRVVVVGKVRESRGRCCLQQPGVFLEVLADTEVFATPRDQGRAYAACGVRREAPCRHEERAAHVRVERVAHGGSAQLDDGYGVGDVVGHPIGSRVSRTALLSRKGRVVVHCHRWNP